MQMRSTDFSLLERKKISEWFYETCLGDMHLSNGYSGSTYKFHVLWEIRHIAAAAAQQVQRA